MQIADSLIELSIPMQNLMPSGLYTENLKLNLIKTDAPFQKLKCVPIIEAPVTDPCCGIKSKCTVFRTKDRLPDIYEDSVGVIIRSAQL